jgi:flagellar biogenesis protein FliO
MKLFQGMILGLTLLTTLVQAEVKVKSMELDATSDKVATLKVHYTGDINGTPELNIGKDHVQVVLNGATVWPKIEKKAHLASANDSTLMAYQFDKNLVRARAIIPLNLMGNEKSVTMKKKTGYIEVTFPKNAQAIQTTSTASTSNESKKDQYDESYLETLSQEKKSEAKNAEVTEVKNNNTNSKVVEDVMAPSNKDVVSTTQSAPVVEAKPTFSIIGYVGKFVAFLGVVLLLFYGVVQLMKKGVLGKGKLGFLNNTNLVEVLSTTYIAPKRSLMLVKAHKQIFLVSNSETGLQFLSEITDTTGLVKQGEREALGTNFDTDLDTATVNENTDKKIKLKQMIAATDTYSDDLSKMVMPNEDKVSFSSELKKKMKGLKPLSN